MIKVSNFLRRPLVYTISKPLILLTLGLSDDCGRAGNDSSIRRDWACLRDVHIRGLVCRGQIGRIHSLADRFWDLRHDRLRASQSLCEGLAAFRDRCSVGAQRCDGGICRFLSSLGGIRECCCRDDLSWLFGHDSLRTRSINCGVHHFHGLGSNSLQWRSK